MNEATGIIATIVTTGIALAGLLLYLFRWLRQDNQVLRQEVRQDMQRLEGRTDAMEHRLNARIDAVNARIDSLISLFTRPGSAA